MAVQTIYVLAATAVTPNWWGNTQLNGSAPTAANTAYGWSANKIAVGFIRGRLGATTTSSDAVVGTSYNAGTSGPTKGTGSGAGTAGDSFVAGPFAGTFAATAWTFAWNLRAGTAGCVGHVNMRIWKSVNADGSAATQLLANTAGATVTLSTTADVNSSISWSPGALTLANEYLFFQVEWQETTLGTTNGDNVLFRAGTAAVTTADFVAACTGTLSATQAVQTLVAAGGPRVDGTLGINQAAQPLAAAGWSSAVGTLSVNQAAQTLLAAGGPRVGGTLSVGQAAQILSGAGTVASSSITGTLSVVQAANTLTGAGSVVVAGSQYGIGPYGRDLYSQATPAGWVSFSGQMSPEVTLAGSLTMSLSLQGDLPADVTLAAQMISGPLWVEEVCPPADWETSGSCPPSMWTPVPPPLWVAPSGASQWKKQEKVDDLSIWHGAAD